MGSLGCKVLLLTIYSRVPLISVATPYCEVATKTRCCSSELGNANHQTPNHAGFKVHCGQANLIVPTHKGILGWFLCFRHGQPSSVCLEDLGHILGHFF